MALVDLLQRKPMPAAVMAGAIMGAVVGLFLPIRAADPPKAEEATWSLPNAQALKRFSDNTYQSVRSAKFWGDLLMPGQRGAEKKQATWTLTGIVTSPAVQVSVSEAGKQGQPVQTWVRVGEKLPDGAVLDAVTRDRIWVTKDDCKRVKSLYQNSVHPDPEGCIGPDGKPVAPPAGTDKPTVVTPTAPVPPAGPPGKPPDGTPVPRGGARSSSSYRQISGKSPA
ncbi:MAG TPA: hypothetical protein PL007_07505 [Thermomonas sp.]|jgi:hypothetical protein|nr:hypothetical protein [Thermomonas sp.]